MSNEFVTVRRESLEQVFTALLDGLQFTKTGLGRPPEQYNPPAIAALRAALEQPGVEPVVQLEVVNTGSQLKLTYTREQAAFNLQNGSYMLYTAPQPAQHPRPAEAQRDRLLAAIAEAQAGASWPTGAALLAGPIAVAVEQVKKEMRK